MLLPHTVATQLTAEGSADDLRDLPLYSALMNAHVICHSTNYTTDQRSPCPLATLNPFGRELLLSDVLVRINQRPRSKGGLILSKGGK
jgi:hypothetical protein